ncbi:MAG: S24/S26 family peptidase [Bacillota bacterium]|nr:S24/S26 family peptidase [Bacillota bacterium]
METKHHHIQPNPQKIELDDDAQIRCIIEQLSQGKCCHLVVSGSSMTPTLKHKRDSVFLFPSQKLRRGDIVLFRRNNGDVVLHRVHRVRDDGLLEMNGDAQPFLEVITEKQVLGVAKGIIRKGRTYHCDGIAMRCYAALWQRLLPLRPFIFRLRGYFKK